MTSSTWARIVLAFNIVATLVIVAVADVFNPSHLYNPDWPPHAAFHLRMQFFTLTAISVFSLAMLARPLARIRALPAALAPLAFWPGLIVAWFFDSGGAYASDGLREVGFPINVALAVVFTALALLGLWLALAGTRSDAHGATAAP